MVIVCRQCGQGADEGTEFCESCGAFLEWEGERVGPAAASPPFAPGSGPGGPTTPDVTAGRVVRPPEPPPAPRPVTPPTTAWSDPSPVAEPAASPSLAGPLAGPAPTAPSGAAGRGRGGSVVCLECGARNEADRRFCRRCGSTLDLVALSSRAPQTDLDDAIWSDEPDGGGGDTTVAPGPATPSTDDSAGSARGPQVARRPAAPTPVVPPRIGARPPAVADGPPVVAGGPPVVAAGPPAPVPARGLQPAEARARPAAVRPQRAEVEVAPGGPLCGQCGTANPPGRRFCRHCGAPTSASGSVAVSDPLAPPDHPSWWRRLVSRVRGDRDADPEAAPTRAARSAYRRSLDVRFRVLRAIAAVAGVGLLAGGVGLAGINPVSGARGLWDRLFPRDQRVGELQALADPVTGVEPDFAPGAAVDGDPGTAWGTTWLLADGAPAAEGCAVARGGATGGVPGPGGGLASLVVTLPEAIEVSKISLQPGLAAGDPDRATQWRPTLVELRFDDGACTTVELSDEAGFQDHRLDRPETSTVRITVLDAAPPTDQAASRGLVTIGEVRVFRPR